MEGVFIKVRNFEVRKMPKLLNFTFPDGRYFLNFDTTKLKRFSKTFFFYLRTASLGGSGLI